MIIAADDIDNQSSATSSRIDDTGGM